VRRAAAASFQAALLKPTAARALLERTAAQIERAQIRNRKARITHHRRREQQLLNRGIDLAASRCCIPFHKRE